MLSNPDQQVPQQLRDALTAAEPDLELKYAAAPRPDRRGRRLRPTRRYALLLAAVVAGLAGATGVAVAADPDSNRIDDIFRGLHPDKNDTSESVEPHDLVGSVQLPGGEQVKLYATDATTAGSCASVVSSSGASISFCQGPSGVDLQVINGALVGYLPQAEVVTVKVTSGSKTSEAPVVHRYFILPPDAGEVGSPVSVTGENAAGEPVVTTRATIT
jgi:hypothetical protein